MKPLEIQNRKDILRETREKLFYLIKNCPHSFPKEQYRENESLKCEICGKYFGWYCPDNPNQDLPVCDYVHDDGHYDEDECKYCGAPDERK